MARVLQQISASSSDTESLPLVVDLDGTLIRTDSLYELFATVLFTQPVATLMALLALLRGGRAAFKRRLCTLVTLDCEGLPVREDFLAYLKQQAEAGREIHLATAADQSIATRIGARFPFFAAAIGSDQGVNLKSTYKAGRLQQLFPGGYVYAGDCRADLAVWKTAKAAIVVSSQASLVQAVRAAGIPVEQVFNEKTPTMRAWLKALRPHQWAKNVIVLVPLLLGWNVVTLQNAITALIMIAILCGVASMTYIINDIADLASDRAHWSKRRRPFASGAIPVRDGLVLVAVVLPTLCILAFLISPLAGACLLVYVVVTVGYSFGWKRIPIFDTFIIGLLFTTRILIGTAAAKLPPSAWLLTFSMFFFLSLALAKRHTEILRAAAHGLQTLVGRGYQIADENLTLTFGISASMASIVIVVIYLVEEVFARQIYARPDWLWMAPIAIFLFTTRVWVLSHTRPYDRRSGRVRVA